MQKKEIFNIQLFFKTKNFMYFINNNKMVKMKKSILLFPINRQNIIFCILFPPKSLFSSRFFKLRIKENIIL